MIQLSVIIPTRNRASILKEALESIEKQTLDKSLFEVIVIDNGSSDNTSQVVNSFKDSIVHLSCISIPEPGLHIGRHAGLKAAKSDILVYADDDIIAFPTWLEGVYESMQDPKVVLVGGKDLPKFEVEPPFWIKEMWYRMQPDGHAMTELSLIDLGEEIKEIPPYYVYGCNYSVRKHIVLEAGGFHPDGMPWDKIVYRGDGEWYINNYISSKEYKVIYNPKASVYHVTPKTRLTLDYFKKRAFCEGVEQSYDDLRYGNPHRYAQPAISWRHPTQLIKRLRQWYKESKMTAYERDIYKSKLIGYNYHQHMYNTHADIKAWVHKESYI